MRHGLGIFASAWGIGGILAAVALALLAVVAVVLAFRRRRPQVVVLGVVLLLLSGWSVLEQRQPVFVLTDEDSFRQCSAPDGRLTGVVECDPDVRRHYTVLNGLTTLGLLVAAAAVARLRQED